MLETLGRHHGSLARRRYGAFGLLGMPYFVVFEAFGPVLEALGYLVLPLAAVMGLLAPGYLAAFFLLAVILGVFLSLGALTLEEYSFRRHVHGRDVLVLFLYGVIENFGHRQLVSLWRIVAFVDVLRGTKSWGDMERKGLARQTPPESL